MPHHAGRWSSAVALCVLVAASAAAQQPLWLSSPASSMCADATIGSPGENTQRIVALLIRDASTSLQFPDAVRQGCEAGLDAAFAASSDAGMSATRLAPVWTTVWLNSSRANPDDDGAVWQGRGLTASVTAGAVAQWRLVSFSLRPIFFTTQNAAFTPTTPNGKKPSAFNEPFWGEAIDLPYRFGRGPRGFLFPGESWLRVGPHMIGLGVSAASERWGPAHASPLVMSTDGAAFPRVFAEVADLPAGAGRLSARWIVARLEGSPYTNLPAGARSRFAVGLTSTFAFAGPLTGLSIGGARFFHMRWDSTSVQRAHLLLPLRGLVKAGNPTGETEGTGDQNQIASIFARVAPPAAGVEVYGEFYRDDHNADFRDLLAEPDHESAYTIGVRRAWRTTPDHTVSAVTLETTNARITHLQHLREQTPMYIHTRLTEGHTYLGQPIGSYGVLGGGGSSVQYDRIGESTALSITAEFQRTAQNVEGGTYYGQPASRVALRVGKTWFAGRLAHSWSLGLDRGIGLEHGTNATMMLSFAAWSGQRRQPAR